MTGPHTRRIEPPSPQKPEADWTLRLALGGAVGFALLLVAFGLMLYNAWPQMSGVRQSVGTLTAKADGIVVGQEQLTRDITALRSDLRDDRARRAGETKDLASVQTRIAELASAVALLREQAARVQETPKAADATTRAAPIPPGPASPDPAIAELRARLDLIQHRLDQLAAAQQAPVQPSPLSPSAPAASVAAVPAKPNYPVDEIEREVRDMQEVVRQQRLGPPPSPTAAQRAGRSIADPLAPLTSKSPPRIAPVSAAAGARVSRVATESSAQQSASVERPAAADAPEPRVSRVGVNSAMKSLGPIGLPFDAIGNLFTVIGEGLDHLFTGRTYLPRPTPGDEPATARR